MSSPAIHCVFLILLIALSTSSAAGEDRLPAYQVLQEYDFPVGLLPIGVKGYELDKSTGKFKAYLNGTCSFKISNYELKYKSTITGVISMDKLKKLKGISVKVLFLWLNIAEVIRDYDELEFSVGIASANFPIESFVASPQCGCGFDCVSGERENAKFDFIRFVASLLD